MSESFRTLLIGISTGTAGQFLSQLTGLLTLWVGAYLVIKGNSPVVSSSLSESSPVMWWVL